MQSSRLGVVFLVLARLSLPLFIRWHHPWLIFALNTVITLSFLPGEMSLWMPLAFIGLGVAIVNRATDVISFLPVPVTPAAKLNAESSSHWRINMWKHVLPEVPKDLLKGKSWRTNSHFAVLPPFIVHPLHRFWTAWVGRAVLSPPRRGGDTVPCHRTWLECQSKRRSLWPNSPRTN